MFRLLMKMTFGALTKVFKITTSPIVRIIFMIEDRQGSNTIQDYI